MKLRLPASTAFSFDTELMTNQLIGALLDELPVSLKKGTAVQHRYKLQICMAEDALSEHDIQLNRLNTILRLVEKWIKMAKTLAKQPHHSQLHVRGPFTFISSLLQFISSTFIGEPAHSPASTISIPPTPIHLLPNRSATPLASTIHPILHV
ncbi:hypothetical protein BLNAU_20862 [Blattamonas nauphoetae]|uniref:Uncharacterized protein n=1 Tax=Blattamonas nauphoetae TaxID=2049346 RepID=A0ABQ9WXZ2_9EUKA|nr:hypothetical protein BLNAU_20862 [Blattamonas nauphoetae]